MGFVLFCAALAWLIQLLALSNREKLPKGVPVFVVLSHRNDPAGYGAVFGRRPSGARVLWMELRRRALPVDRRRRADRLRRRLAHGPPAPSEEKVIPVWFRLTVIGGCGIINTLRSTK